MIPIDSRLEKLFFYFRSHSNPLLCKERGQKEIKDFYIKLSENLNIPLLHLDAILWINFDELVEN
jgi:N-glycosylase/DNA lyase